MSHASSELDNLLNEAFVTRLRSFLTHQPLVAEDESRFRNVEPTRQNYLPASRFSADVILGADPWVTRVVSVWTPWDRHQAWRSTWRRVRDMLKAWYAAPERALEPDRDDLDVPPTKVAILAAGRIAHRMVLSRLVEPDQVIPSRDGGIVFYSDHPHEVTKALRVSPSGAMRLVTSSRGHVESSVPFEEEATESVPPIWESRSLLEGND